MLILYKNYNKKQCSANCCSSRRACGAMVEAAHCSASPSRLKAWVLHGCCAPLQKFSNHADGSVATTKRERVRFLPAIEVRGVPTLRAMARGHLSSLSSQIAVLAL
jgi:hypothetical protein